MKAIARATYGAAFLLTCWASCRGQDGGAKPIEATLCDLYQHPEQYAGRIIKVRGGSVGGELRIENILHDSPAAPCPTYMRIVVVFPDRVKPSPGFQLVRDESYRELEAALHRGGPVHIDATYEGRFDAAFAWRDGKRLRVDQAAAKGYGKGHEYDARIVLRQVSDVWAGPVPHR